MTSFRTKCRVAGVDPTSDVRVLIIFYYGWRKLQVMTLVWSAVEYLRKSSYTNVDRLVGSLCLKTQHFEVVRLKSFLEKLQ